MCGILAIINKDHKQVKEDLLLRMTRTLVHRGPDDEGFYRSKNFGLGHNRLSIIDLSSKAAQPMSKHGLVMAYNGEIYNYQDLRKELESLGIIFFSQSDTEVLLSAYKVWGPGFESRLNGMWVFLIFDEKEESVYISRDRYGMKPLYLYETDQQLIFASEIKAFKQSPTWTNKLNVSVVSDFLCYGLMHHQKQSLFERVTMLPAASYSIYTLEAKRIELKAYYEVPTDYDSTISPNIVSKTFFQSVKDHLVADVEIAASLSGGIDSAAVTSIAALTKPSIKTFSYIPDESSFNEEEYIESLVKSKDLDNIRITADFSTHMEHHRKTLLANDAPALSMNLVSHYLMYSAIKDNGIKVLLGGQGADELLAGYGTYYAYLLKDLRRTQILKWIQELFYLITTYAGFSKKIISKFKGIDNYEIFLVNPKSSQEARFIDFKSYYCYMISEGLLPALLQFEDRNSMAHGVEGRLPFLDKDFGELCHKISPNKKIKKGIRKYIFREAMKGIVPQKILDRKDKMGFVTPQELWIKQNEAYFLEKIKIGITNYPGWLKPTVIPFIEKKLKKNHKASFPFIWRVYSFFEFMETLHQPDSNSA